MTRDDMIAAVEALPGARVPAGFVIESDETDNHVTHDHVFCFKHADMVARLDALLVGADMFVVNVSQAEADSAEFCAFAGCSEELNVGSLTDHGVDSALGLTEEDPLACHVSAHELKRSAWAMLPDDPRWETWEIHAKRVLTRHRRGRRCSP